VYLAATGHPQYYVTASHDDGATWTPLEALDCNETTAPGGHEACGSYPEIGAGLIDAANGVLSATYLAGTTPVPPGGGDTADIARAPRAAEQCPCAIFETSRDDGAHWKRHVVATGLSANALVQLAADPRRAHRFAVSILSAPNTSLAVYATSDSGKSWTTPTRLGDMPGQHVVNRPWIAISPQGRIGVFWRTAFPPFATGSFLQPGTQNVYVALSRDGTFSAPTQINAQPSPPPDPTQIAQDDVSWVSLTNKNVYAAWGDWRPTLGNPKGDLNSWIGRVPFAAFGP
jgi:hypothetical protein